MDREVLLPGRTGRGEEDFMALVTVIVLVVLGPTPLPVAQSKIHGLRILPVRHKV